MIRTVCRKCDTALMAPDEYAGKSPRCPVCETKIPAQLKTERPAEIEEMLAAARADSSIVDIATSSGAASEKPKPAAKHAPEAVAVQPPRQRSHWIITGPLLGLLALAIAAAGTWALVRYAQDRLAENRSTAVRMEFVRYKDNFAGARARGAQLLQDKKYAEAKRVYEGAMRDSEAMRASLRAVVFRFGDGRAPRDLLDDAKFVDDTIGELQKVLASDAIVKGANGYVDFEGQWVTKEKYDELYVEKMKRAGMYLYKDKWVSREEYGKLTNQVWHDEQWMPREQYEAWQKREEEKKRLAEEVLKKQREAETKRREAIAAARKAEADRRRSEQEAKAKRFAPENATWVLDTFDEAMDWKPVNWGPDNVNPITMSVVDHKGGKALQIAAQKGTKDKVAFVLNVGYDWSSRREFTFDIEAPANGARVAIAVETDGYYESRPRPLKEGLNKAVSFDLSAGDYKGGPDKDWAHYDKTIKKRDYILRIYVLIYNAGEGDYYFDNVYTKK